VRSPGSGNRRPRNVKPPRRRPPRRPPEVPQRPGRPDRDRENHPRRPELTGDLTRHTCRRPGRDAVVDDDRDTSAHGDPFATSAITGHPRFKLSAFLPLDGAQIVLTDPRAPAHVGVEHPSTSFADGPHRQLGLERNSQLSDHDHIERRVQRLGHLERNGHPTPRQTQDHHILITQVRQPLRELTARVDPITKDGHHQHLSASPPTDSLASPGGPRGAIDSACHRGLHSQVIATGNVALTGP
jgi:hypothetical protein